MAVVYSINFNFGTNAEGPFCYSSFMKQTVSLAKSSLPCSNLAQRDFMRRWT